MIKNVPLVIAISIFALVFQPASARADKRELGGAGHYVQRFETGRVDWTTGEITVSTEASSGSGYQSSLAVRKAIVQARKHLYDILASLNLDSERTIGVYLSGDSAVQSRVRSLLQNSRMDRFSQVGRVAVRAGADLRGTLAKALFPYSVQFQGGVSPQMSVLVSDCLEQSPKIKELVPELSPPALVRSPVFAQELLPTEADFAAMGLYTGLVVDARGLGALPALLPLVFDVKGQGVYGPHMVGREAAARLGVVTYVRSEKSRAVRSRSGRSPFLTKALAVAGSGRSDLVISEEAGEIARGLFKRRSVLSRCSVVVLLD